MSEVETTTAAEVATKKVKKLSKVIENGILTIKESITNSTLTFDPAGLSADIQKNLMYHGLSQKLGDAAAGREGKDAVDSINKVWEGLVKGDFTIRVPAAEKVSKKSILDKFNAMPDGKEKDRAAAALKALGLM